jgi:hypothetical protein
MKFTIELDEQQMHVVAKALENYARMGMGQLDVSVEEFLRLNFFNDYYEQRTVVPVNPLFNTMGTKGGRVDAMVNEIKMLVFKHAPNASWGIANKKVPEICREAWDICQVVRKAKAELYHERHPDAHKGVHMGPYMATNPKLPPVVVTRLLEGEEDA